MVVTQHGCLSLGLSSSFAFLFIRVKEICCLSIHHSMICVHSIDSYSVWVRHPICGLFSTGSSVGSGEQYIGSKSGRMETDHPVQTHGARKSQRHRCMAAHHARNSSSGCGDQCEQTQAAQGRDLEKPKNALGCYLWNQMFNTS